MNDAIPTSDDLVLLLLFKDEPQELCKPGFPLVTDSVTVQEHLKVVAPKPQKKPMESAYQLDLFMPKGVQPSVIKPQVPKTVPDGCCVWGWWRKPWECNDRFLARLQKMCSEGQNTPDVILYNQYLRRAYLATLYDVYFVSKANTVEIPHEWVSYCPEYYADATHLCGGYFVLKMTLSEKNKVIEHNPSELLRKYRVDELSFPILGEDFQSVISLPEGIHEACAELVDKSPTPQGLKATEHTIFALRKKTQKELTERLLYEGTTDDALANAFKCTVWNDIEEILRSLSRDGWDILMKRPNTLRAISDVSPDRGIIAFDIYLAGWAILSDQLKKDLIPNSSNREQSERDFRKKLIEWLLECDALKKREKAAQLFIFLWDLVKKRYQLDDITGYFAKLPSMEEIAYSTQYGLKHKFYRDHLNHNIRAGLLAAYLAELVLPSDPQMYNRVLVSFLAGLLHDIAHPLASYEKVGKAIEETLELLKLPISSRVQALVDRNEAMRENICVVVLLSSISDLETKQKEPLLPWKFRDKMIKMAEPRLLFEEVICAICNDHALLSAVVVLNAALTSDSIDSRFLRLRDILQRGSGPKLEEPWREFLNLIQSIALHDRKISSTWHGGREEQGGVPMPLDFINFPVPTIVAIADNLQEWGRPIADFRKTLVIGCDITIKRDELLAIYDVNVRASAIGGTPYSFLEHFFAKARNFSQIGRNDDNKLKFEVMARVEGELMLSDCGLSASELVFEADDPEQVIWPYREEDQITGIKLTPDRVFLALRRPASKQGIDYLTTSDFIVLNTENSTQILSAIGNKESVKSINIKPPNVKIEMINCQISGTIDRYHFRRLKKAGTMVKTDDQIDFSEPVGILEMKEVTVSRKLGVTRLARKSGEPPHLYPCPHFLDLDWRFSSESIYAILQFIAEHGRGGRACYLGCPTLALYHEASEGIEVEYTLLDKGHYGIETWCQAGLIDGAKIIKYDVFKKLPEGLMQGYDIVIMDSPWYEEYYEVFWYRAMELVKPGKFIGVAEYPGYKRSKLNKMESIRKTIVKELGGKSFFASIEISYSAPDFEKAWQADKTFTHTAIGAYRPAYMDFYQIDVPRVSIGDISKRYEHLPVLSKVIDLGDGHYVRCTENLDMLLKTRPRISLSTRKSLDRQMHTTGNIIGWNTKNTIVEVKSKGEEGPVDNQEDLIEIIKKWEQRHLAAP